MAGKLKMNVPSGYRPITKREMEKEGRKNRKGRDGRGAKDLSQK